jgi:DNA-binding MarR family transcriptional regulator
MLDDWARERPDLDLSPLGVFGRISRISRHLDREVSRKFRAEGLSSWAFYVLAALVRAGPPYQLTPTDLYRSLLVSSGVMTNRIARLERLGLVRRVPDPADGRGVLVALTPKGRRAVNRAIEHHNENEKAMLAPLTVEERQKVAASLRKLLIAAGDKPHSRSR